MRVLSKIIHWRACTSFKPSLIGVLVWLFLGEGSGDLVRRCFIQLGFLRGASYENTRARGLILLLVENPLKGQSDLPFQMRNSILNYAGVLPFKKKLNVC